MCIIVIIILIIIIVVFNLQNMIVGQAMENIDELIKLKRSWCKHSSQIRYNVWIVSIFKFALTIHSKVRDHFEYHEIPYLKKKTVKNR